MEESMNQNPEAVEALISKLFTNISSLKSAYIQLQTAHTPYDPEKIQAADKLVISELKHLSELKHFYREKNPKPVCVSPQDSRLAAEIQEQQSLLKTYEVMVKKFQSEIQNKDSEIRQLQQQIEDGNQKRVKLEKNIKVRGLSMKESEGSGEENGVFPVDLTPELFTSAVESAFKAIHDFSKPLINMMKAAGWDLDAAAESIEPNVVYAKRAHKKYAFESHICQRMFSGFQQENFSIKLDNATINKESFFHQYLALGEMDPLDMLGQNPDSLFGKFSQSKYLMVVHPKMEASFFGNLDQRNYVMGGGHPRTPFYQAFLKLAKSIWLLHRLAYSFDPDVKVFQVKRGSEFSEVYMESVEKNLTMDETDEKPKVGLMVMPGFWIGGSVIKSRVYLSGMKLVPLNEYEKAYPVAVDAHANTGIDEKLAANSSTQNEQQLAQVALTISLYKARYTRSYMLKVAKELESIKGKDYPAVRDCLQQIDDNVSQLSQSIRELCRYNPKTGITDGVFWHIDNVDTWISAAVTDASSCAEAFPGHRMSKMKATIKGKVMNVAQLTSNALALFHRYAARCRSAANKKP
ncbi:hypothetical protein V6N11_077983 [Hibiscus sabdariffa]|uniref:Pectinesterase inhibitor domain-containing protein n=1 Tax=Hibiscus sabdariffa TaxID=183260 RepID=A0ABR2TF25_9ROSI